MMAEVHRPRLRSLLASDSAYDYKEYVYYICKHQYKQSNFCETPRKPEINTNLVLYIYIARKLHMLYNS